MKAKWTAETCGLRADEQRAGTGTKRASAVGAVVAPHSAHTVRSCNPSFLYTREAPQCPEDSVSCCWIQRHGTLPSPPLPSPPARHTIGSSMLARPGEPLCPLSQKFRSARGPQVVATRGQGSVPLACRCLTFAQCCSPLGDAPTNQRPRRDQRSAEPCTARMSLAGRKCPDRVLFQ